MMLLRLLNYIILLIPILVNVAFITLLERKILGYSQLRKGPNKVRIIGIAQPFNDAIKLFTKEIVYPKLSNIFQYLISPFCGLIIVLITCILIPFKEIILPSRITIIFLYMIIRINIYPVLISGRASNRKYALIGALRAVAQTVSYEVCLALILIFYLCLVGSIRIILIIIRKRSLSAIRGTRGMLVKWQRASNLFQISRSSRRAWSMCLISLKIRIMAMKILGRREKVTTKNKELTLFQIL